MRLISVRRPSENHVLSVPLSIEQEALLLHLRAFEISEEDLSYFRDWYSRYKSEIRVICTDTGLEIPCRIALKNPQIIQGYENPTSLYMSFKIEVLSLGQNP